MHLAQGVEFHVWVKLRHKDTFREVQARVIVLIPDDDPTEALLVGLQLASTHREGWMPIDGRIVKAVL